MLLLTRRNGESFYIGKNQEIKVTILGNSQGYSQVRVGITADREKFPIQREELLTGTKKQY